MNATTGSAAMKAYRKAEEALASAEKAINDAIEYHDAKRSTHAWHDRLAEVQEARAALSWGRVQTLPSEHLMRV